MLRAAQVAPGAVLPMMQREALSEDVPFFQLAHKQR